MCLDGSVHITWLSNSGLDWRYWIQSQLHRHSHYTITVQRVHTYRQGRNATVCFPPWKVNISEISGVKKPFLSLNLVFFSFSTFSLSPQLNYTRPGLPTFDPEILETWKNQVKEKGFICCPNGVRSHLTSLLCPSVFFSFLFFSLVFPGKSTLVYCLLWFTIPFGLFLSDLPAELWSCLLECVWPESPFGKLHQGKAQQRAALFVFNLTFSWWFYFFIVVIAH